MFRSVEGRRCNLLDRLREGNVSLLSNRGNWTPGEVSAATCGPNVPDFCESERVRAAESCLCCAGGTRLVAGDTGGGTAGLGGVRGWGFSVS